MLKHIKEYFNFSANQIINIEQIIKPVYFVTSLLGLFPYNVTFIKSKNTFVSISKSVYFNSLCGLTIILTSFAFLALHIQDIFLSSENVSMTEEIMTQMNYVLELVTLIIFCTVAYVCAFINRDKYVNILNMITSTWHSIPLSGNSQNILAQLKFRVNILTMGTIILVLLIQTCINFTRNSSVWKIILVALTFNLPQTIQFTTLAFYYTLVLMLAAILAEVNENCLLLAEDKTSKELIEVKSKSTVTLRQIELIYVKAFEIKTYINEAFQGPILASAIQCFHSIVSEAHIIYHGIVIDQDLTTHDVLNCTVWIAYQLLKIYILSHAGNSLKLMALKIGQTVHNIPTEKKDLRWLMEIQHFSSLMSFQRIEMTVYEYFPLDATLLYNMLASAMMYLIILVQFDKRE